MLDPTHSLGLGSLRLGDRHASHERAASPLELFIVYSLAVGEHAGAVALGPGSGVGNGCARVALTTTGTMPPVPTLIDGCPTAPRSELIVPPCAVIDTTVHHSAPRFVPTPISRTYARVGRKEQIESAACAQDVLDVRLLEVDRPQLVLFREAVLEAE